MIFPMVPKSFRVFLFVTMTGIILASCSTMSMSSSRNTVREEARLRLGEDGWNLISGSTGTTSRTRHGGSGRPNPHHRRSHFNEDPTSSTDSDYEADSSSDDESASSDDSSSVELEVEEDDDNKKPPPTRLFVELESLKKCMEKNCRCPNCNGPVEMKVKTLCLASNVMVCCLDNTCGYVDVSDQPATAELGEKTDDRERSTDFAINILYVLGFLSSGDGGTEAARLLGLLGLPNDTTMQTRSFGLIEERISPFIQKVTDELLLENLSEEVRLTFAQLPDKDESDLITWKNSLSSNIVYSTAKYPSISVSFDMGWQQRSSGVRYNSPSGHAFFVGGLCRKPIALQVKSRICNYCLAWKKKNPPSEEFPDGLPVAPHACTINHEGSSASMEPRAGLDMIIDLFHRRHVSIARICVDDDASTPALLKWSNADYCNNNNTPKPPQVNRRLKRKDGTIKHYEEDRPDSGRLPGHIPEPKWVADPNHRKKLFTKDLRAFKGDTSKDRFGMSDMDVTRLGKSYGYMIRGLKRITEDKYVDAAKAVVEHHYDNHEYCGQWCPRRRLTDHEKNLSERYYRSKVNDAKLYVAINQIAARFITLPKLKEVAHVMDTQVNESMNNTIAWLAPKNKCFGGSQSLKNRISLAVGITSLGLHKYFTRLFHSLCITMPPNIHHFLGVRERRRQQRIGKTKEKAHKRLRKERLFEKLRKDEQVKRNEKKKNFGTYRSGINMEDPNGPEVYAWVKPPKKRSKQSTDVVCKHCGMTGHSRTSSRKCLKHKAKDTEVTAASVLVASEQDPDDSEEEHAIDLENYAGETLEQHLQRHAADDAKIPNDNDIDSEVQEAHIL
jgi:hypothetical protein